MAKYSVEIKKSAAKEIRKLPKKDLKVVMDKIHALSENPRPADSKKLSAQEKYRMRCGRYRILYSVENDVLIVYIVKVRHRRDVYRKI